MESAPILYMESTSPSCSKLCLAFFKKTVIYKCFFVFKALPNLLPYWIPYKLLGATLGLRIWYAYIKS
jgi:hypothetical protein